MKQIKTVFSFTFKEGISKKSFKISTGIILAIVLILFVAARFLLADEKVEYIPPVDNEGEYTPPGDDEGEYIPPSDRGYYSGHTCYYIDEDNLIKGAIPHLYERFPGIEIVSIPKATTESYQDLMESENEVLIIEVLNAGENPNLVFYTGDFMSSINPQDFADILEEKYIENALLDSGIDESALEIFKTKLFYSTKFLGKTNIAGYTLGILLTLLTFISIHYLGHGVAMSVATEKSTRVMETLIVSSKPSKILIGKCLAMGLLGIVQFGGILLFGIGCYNLILPKGLSIMGMAISFEGVNVGTVLILLTYFVLGYSLFAVLNALSGAAVSKLEDLNSALVPINMVSLFSFYIGYFTAISGGSGIMLTVAKYLPFSSPYTVPFLLLNNNIKASELLISLTLLLIAVIIFAYLSIRIYSASVLHYGKRQNPFKFFKNKA